MTTITITMIGNMTHLLVVTLRYMETCEPGAGGCSKAKQMYVPVSEL